MKPTKTNPRLEAFNQAFLLMVNKAADLCNNYQQVDKLILERLVYGLEIAEIEELQKLLRKIKKEIKEIENI